MIDFGYVVLQASRLDLHCPVEILRLEFSRSISEIDLPLKSTWLDPYIGVCCVLDRLEVIQLVLTPFSHNPMHNRQLLIITTIENIS